MKNRNWIVLPLICNLFALSFSSCVTVNVNIPEGDIQQASDSYVRELYDAKQKNANPEAEPDLKNAGNPRVKTDSPQIKEIYARMKTRNDAITLQKQAGFLGEGNEGKLILKGKPSATDLDLIKKLIAEENKDRTALYQELMKQNGGLKSNRVSFEHHFAEAFQAHSPPNTWVQDEDGNWTQKQ